MTKTRFAPSPTGNLHIGGARTALFAWAWARQQGGKFLLRVEDTDRARSSAAHAEGIIRAMDWLGMTPDEPPIFQSAHAERHRQVARQLLVAGKAYHCYCSPDELAAMRAADGAARYDRRWRDSRAEPPPGVSPVIRLKSPLTGRTRFSDAVKGDLSVDNAELDDFIILRADGAPTYNLAAALDDADAGISHVIRGDDHVMNTFRQWHLFSALSARPPVFAHLPMIFAADGEDADGNIRYARLSKRAAATDVNDYREAGFLPAALRNYLARLSWGHGDAEVFDRDFLVAHFSFAAVSRSPARFDMDKLRWLNREHIRQTPAAELRRAADIPAGVGDAAIALLRDRVGGLGELRDEAAAFANRPVVPADLLSPYLEDATNAAALRRLRAALAAAAKWDADSVRQAMRETAAAAALPFKRLGMPMRAMLFGKTDSPDIALAAAALGREETLARLAAVDAAAAGDGGE